MKTDLDVSTENNRKISYFPALQKQIFFNIEIINVAWQYIYIYMESIYFTQYKNAVLLQTQTLYVTISRITIQIIKKLKNYYI